MERRDVLKGLSSSALLSLCGCLSTANSNEDNTNTLNLEHVAISGEARVDIQAETRSQDSDSPPKVAVRLTNGSDQMLRFGPYQPLSTPAAKNEDSSAELLLIPEELWDGDVRYYVPEQGGVDDYVPETRQSGCWTATSEIRMIRQQAVHMDLPQGESVASTYNILNAPQNETCFPAGTYRVEDTLGAGATDYDWSLTLTVQ